VRSAHGWPLLLVLSLAAACAKDAPPPVPQDPVMTRNTEAGQNALGLDRPAEAATQFQAALTQAEARDDLNAIVQISFNLAVSQLRANRPADALATAQRAQDELSRRGAQPSQPLQLIAATALYRTGHADQADALASGIETAADPDAAAGASFLRGLIADEAGNAPGLQAALGRLPTGGGPVREADRLELQARLQLRQNGYATARGYALQAAELRQRGLDYRGMARVLAVAGSAAERAGDAEGAADLYLRAGRSAAAQSDAVTARPLLERAEQLTRNPATKAAASLALANLSEE
jgi:hypothetical protein